MGAETSGSVGQGHTSCHISTFVQAHGWKLRGMSSVAGPKATWGPGGSGYTLREPEDPFLVPAAFAV